MNGSDLVDRLYRIDAELGHDDYPDERYVDTDAGEFDNHEWLCAERREILRALRRGGN